MMDKTIKINLGGTLFRIDEEAYKKLRQYLHDLDAKLRNTQGGAETLEDIESRIAEIFQSQVATAGVISLENVNAMISLIGSPETFDTVEELKDNNYNRQRPVQKKMYRNPDDRIISGVCGGIGAYLGIEPVWVRLLFILFACFFGAGFIVYLALWIALPVARSEAQKKEMYGSNIRTGRGSRISGDQSNLSSPSYSAEKPAGTGIGNAFDQVFRAIGRAGFIVIRVFLIILGVCFVVTGFAMLVSFVMIFFFKYPDYFSTHSLGFNLFYLPDFLNFIVNPAIAPWIIVLSFIVILMPLLALIYWGIKMIFWFRARDGIFALGGLVIWVMSVAALSILLANEGISFSETSKIVSGEVLNNTRSELYIASGHKITDLQFDKEISIPDEDYNIYFSDDNKRLYISPVLNINPSDDKKIHIDIRKRSTGRSRSEATHKAESLIYDYSSSHDTIYLDNYFSIPEGSKWSFDNVTVSLSIPDGTVVHFDQASFDMFRQHYYHHWENDNEESHYHENASLPWVMTEEGLRPKSDN
ncbi:MAG: PspC domain-containing protein [Bacteroidales bacterium]